jgi:ribosomal protein S16
LEIIGYWHPAKNDIKIDKEKIKKWIDKGAVLTNAVKKLI